MNVIDYVYVYDQMGKMLLINNFTFMINKTTLYCGNFGTVNYKEKV